MNIIKKYYCIVLGYLSLHNTGLTLGHSLLFRALRISPLAGISSGVHLLWLLKESTYRYVDLREGANLPT